MAFKWFNNKKDTQNKNDILLKQKNKKKSAAQDSADEKNLNIFPADSGKQISDLKDSARFLNRLKNRLSKTRKTLASGFDTVFSGRKSIDDELLEALEELLITSDIGVQTSMDIIGCIEKKPLNISNAEQLKEILKKEILSFFDKQIAPSDNITTKPYVIMVVGINGVGKTTTIGKLAAKFTGEGKKVLIAASDTFRAAASEQLSIWADRADAGIVVHKSNSDPAAVAYDTIEAAIARDTDIVLVDTAGRLHTSINLMEELKKIKRTLSKRIFDAPHEILLVLDATTGQNALSQAKLFHEALGINGIVLTKLDGTAKGGILVSICRSLEIPLKYIGIGEQIDDLIDFDPKQFVDALF
ncbi:MAG TPA: signal recognition particle-docking protein FtsY [Desulfobacteraceae bacterium]|nr:signal recognition particle-docking protein FtsY [Desulfobacteraceae bacterium]